MVASTVAINSFALAKKGCYYAMMLVVVVAASLTSKVVSPSSETTCDIPSIPEEWWSWRRKHFWMYLDCTKVIESGRPVYSQKEWVMLRKVYRDVVGSDNSTILPSDDVDGFFAPIVVKVMPDKGRGLFAAKDIPKGTLIWTAEHQTAEFPSAHSFRRFLSAIPPEMACDVLEWAYVMPLVLNGTQKPAMMIELDEGTYMNTVDHGYEPNAGPCTTEIQNMIDGECKDGEYALRDINAGEEIVCDYFDFEVPWIRFGV